LKTVVACSLTMTEPRKRGEEPFNARHNFGYKKFTPDTAQVNYECPLCLTKPAIDLSYLSPSVSDPLAQQHILKIQCRCFSETKGYDKANVETKFVADMLVSEFRSKVCHRINRAGAPPKGVSLKDWVVGITRYFGARGQLAPRTSELSEGEKMFMWREIRG